MGRYLALTLLVLVIIAFGSFIYFSQTVSEYYTVSEYPTTAYDNKKKLEIKKVKQYESDSLAIDEETKKYHYMQEDWNRMMEDAKKKGDTGGEMINARFRNEQRCLIKITHRRLFDFDKFKELVIKHGPNSAQVDTYCKNNNVDMTLFPMLSDY